MQAISALPGTAYRGQPGPSAKQYGPHATAQKNAEYDEKQVHVSAGFPGGVV